MDKKSRTLTASSADKSLNKEWEDSFRKMCQDFAPIGSVKR